MFALERLLREGPHRRGFASGVRPGSWFFPTLIQLAWIIYNASFGFRAQNPAGGPTSESTPAIRRAREMQGVVVINRVRQMLRLSPGWAPHAGGNFRQYGTEPAVQRNEPGFGLNLPGNQLAFNECMAAARRALQYKWSPLDAPELLGGAQFYAHHRSLLSTVNGADNHRVAASEPMYWPGKPHGERTGWLLLIGRNEAVLRLTREWEQTHADEIQYPSTI